MGKNNLRVGVIGVGQIGTKHLETYLRIPGVQVAAIADRDPHRAEQIAGKFGIPFWTTDYHILLDREDVEAVSVCLHNNLHRTVTVAALEAGRHVLCEKPMSGSYRDAQEMMAVSRRTEKLLSIQLLSLFENETKAARVVIDKGWLGRIYHGYSARSRRRGRPYVDGYGTKEFVQKSQAAGGALYDLGVYHISALLYLMDNPRVLRICGHTYQEVPMDPVRNQASGYDVEEFAVGLVHFEKNMSLQIAEAWAIHLDGLGQSYLVGSEGGIKFRPFGGYRSLGDLDMDCTADLDAFDFRQQTVQGYGNAYEGPIQHYVAALRHEVPLLPTAEVALNTMLISEGIYLSNRLNREVNPQEVMENSVVTAINI